MESTPPNPPPTDRLGRLVKVGVIVGLALRIWEYSSLRDLYMDETALLTNLVGVPAFDFTHVLKQDQLAPPGFLVVERLLVRLPIPTTASGRLLPLCLGLASMLLIAPLARRYLDRAAVPIAVWMLALADHLIYYSAEIKPYTCDLVGAMVTLLLAVPPDPGEPTRRRLRALAAWGMVAPWFSFPVVFVLAGVGLHLVARSWRSGGRRGVGLAVAVGVGWLVSFLGCFVVSRSIVSKRDFLWVWWDFAFLPIPPRSWVAARFTIETIANVFINPGSVLTPFGFIPTAVMATLLAVVGAAALGRRWRGGLFLVLTPLVVHLAVSALRQYPFHGRLILSLVPTFHLLLAEGIAAVGRRTRPWATLILALTFLGGQAGDIVWNQMVMPKSRSRPFDTHGDLKNDLLDDLDFRRKPKMFPDAARLAPGMDLGGVGPEGNPVRHALHTRPAIACPQSPLPPGEGGPKGRVRVVGFAETAQAHRLLAPGTPSALRRPSTAAARHPLPPGEGTAPGRSTLVPNRIGSSSSTVEGCPASARQGFGSGEGRRG